MLMKTANITIIRRFSVWRHSNGDSTNLLSRGSRDGKLASRDSELPFWSLFSHGKVGQAK